MDYEESLVREFSERECQIITLIADGLTNQEIADRVYLAKNTIKWYVQQLNQKLYTESRDEIVVEAERLGLLDNAINGYIRDNLPRQTTVFVGREAELDTLHDIFSRDDVRLLTILAPGGMGKTRLALELLEQNLNYFRDGVYFIPLQSLSDTTELITQIATITGLQISGNFDDMRKQLLNFLSRRNLVLLLDNFEHLLNTVNLVNDILKTAPDVKLVLTSRERLNLLGETIYTLQGMSYTEWRTPGDARTSDAVQLLKQTIQRIHPTWRITEQNLATVGRLCQLTDGMPLGILLAASLMDILTLEGICDEIEKSVDILQTDMRDIPPRQRSIRAIFNTAWAGLNADEQAVFMKMSVFRGGGSPDAVQAIAEAKPRILQRLVRKALLSHRNGRYEFHELLRQYAEEQLEKAGLSEETQTTHINYYATLLHNRESDLKNAHQLMAIEHIETDFENILAMWYRAIAQQRTDIFDQTLESLRMFFLLSNRMDTGTRWLSDAIETLESSQHPIVVKLKVYYANALIESSHIEPALRILKQYEAQIRQHSDVLMKLQALVSLGRSSYLVGEVEQARVYALEFLEFATKENEVWQMAQAHFALSLISERNDMYVPLQHIEQCIDYAQQIGDYFWQSQAYTLSGLMLRRIGELDRADAHTEKAYQYCRQLNDKMGMTGTLNNLGESAKARGDWQSSEDYHRKSLEVAQDLGYSYHYAWALNKLAHIHLIQGDIEQAEHAITMSEDIVYTMDYTALYIIQYTTMSAIAEYKGDFSEAHHLATKGYNQEGGVNWAITNVITERLAWTLCCIDAYDEAIPHLVSVIEQHLQIGSIWHFLTDIALVSLVYTNRQQYEKAIELLAFVSEHDIQSVWLRQHPKLRQLRNQLSATISQEQYQQAWERGYALDAKTILTEILADLRPL